MKRSVILSVLAAVAIFMVSNAEAGMFGRLHVLRGCNPCEPVACEPCEPVACNPCEPVCESEPSCYDPCARGPFRPFGGFFLGLRSKLAVKHCSPCEPVACEPCEPVACNPCEPACDPCEPSCYDPCARPFRPFGGFFANAWARWKAKSCSVGCDPCEPACDPCAPQCCN